MVANASPTAFAALFVFLAGQIVLLVGLLWNAQEVGISNQAVEYEAQRIERLREEKR
ncbi:MAG: hypothetical protein JOZ41_18980 [Chloroflexi bacterium]|nr:hypothetical protein [Chloroflexota bacterium]